MRAIYTLDVEDNTETAADLGYAVTIYEHGKKIGDGVAGNLRAALIESLEESGILA